MPAFVIHPTLAQFAAAAAAKQPDLPYGWERALKKAEQGEAGAKTLSEGHAILEPIVERERARQHSAEGSVASR